MRGNFRKGSGALGKCIRDYGMRMRDVEKCVRVVEMRVRDFKTCVRDDEKCVRAVEKCVRDVEMSGRVVKMRVRDFKKASATSKKALSAPPTKAGRADQDRVYFESAATNRTLRCKPSNLARFNGEFLKVFRNTSSVISSQSRLVNP